MRSIRPDWTAAQWARLGLFLKADDYGVEVDPARMAPFSFRSGAGGEVEMVMDNIHIGHVTQGAVLVRRDFPPRFDFAVLRAVNALRDVNDEIGRLDRARKRQEKAAEDARRQAEREERANRVTSGFLIEVEMTNERLARGVDEREVDLPEDFVRKGLYGLAYANGHPNLRAVSWQRIALTVPHPALPHSNAQVTFTFEAGERPRVYTHEYRADLNLPGFEEELRKGVEAWDARIDPEKVMEDLGAARTLPRLDISTLARFPYGASVEGAPDNMIIGGLKVRRSPQYAAHYEAFHNGQFLATFGLESLLPNGPNGRMMYAGPRIGGAFVDDDDHAALVHMAAHLHCASLGLDPSTMRELSEDLVAKRVEETDFGYLG